MRGWRYTAIIFVSMALLIPQCATSNGTIDIFKHRRAFVLLSGKEKDLVEDICDKIDASNQKTYYINKLILLLNTPFVDNSSELKQKQLSDLDDSVAVISAAEKHFNNVGDEEALEKSFDLRKYAPKSNWPAYYLISNSDPLNIFIKIKVNLIGDGITVSKMQSLEDAVEKHLAVPGFTVNIEWSNIAGPDVFNIETRYGEWATSINWAGDYTVMAHELMHLFGLDDEYNLITSHAGNRHVSVLTRLEWFLFQMDLEEIPNAENGIMRHSWKKPLARHICGAVGLGDSCVNARIKEYVDYN